MHTRQAVSQREEWVDVARCLAMVCIMILHAGAPDAVLWRPVSGAICLFFILAGYFMPREAGEAARRGVQLGVAWALWSLISWALYVLVQPGIEWSWARVFGIGCSAYNVPLWFLKDLCIFQLLVAGLCALRLLPRYVWLALALLVGCTYAAEPGQHEALRFDWLSAVLLGYALRGCATPAYLRGAAIRYAWLLLVAGVLLMLQRAYYPELLQRFGGVRSAESSLPVEALVWAAWYALAGIGIVRFLPRAASAMARVGACMLFIYAAHSLAYAPFYSAGVSPLPGGLIMVGIMAALAVLYYRLVRLFPRTLRVLTARRR